MRRLVTCSAALVAVIWRGLQGRDRSLNDRTWIEPVASVGGENGIVTLWIFDVFFFNDMVTTL